MCGTVVVIPTQPYSTSILYYTILYYTILYSFSGYCNIISQYTDTRAAFTLLPNRGAF